MTTLISQSNSSRQPAPSDYSNRIERMARENALFIARKRRERMWRRIAIASGVVLVVVAAWTFFA